MQRGFALFAYLLSGGLLQRLRSTGSAGTVASIQIKANVGPANVSDEMIRANIRMKPGDPYVRSSIDDDVKNLYATGLFYNIQWWTDFDQERGAHLYHPGQAAAYRHPVHGK